MLGLFPDPSSPLTDVEIFRAIELLTDPSVDHEGKILFLATLHERGEIAEELAGFARHLLERDRKSVV